MCIMNTVYSAISYILEHLHEVILKARSQDFQKGGYMVSIMVCMYVSMQD